MTADTLNLGSQPPVAEPARQPHSRLRHIRIWLFRNVRRLLLSAVAGGLVGVVFAFIGSEITGDHVHDDGVLAAGSVSAICIWLYLATAAWRRESPIAVEIGLAAPDDTVALDTRALSQVVLSLRIRARRLRAAANFTLVLIIAALVLGSATFVNAGARASRESDITRIQLDYIDHRVADLENRLVTESDQRLIPFIQRELAVKRIERERISRTLSAQPKLDTTVYAISALTTRIGAVLLLLFLVQILTSLYRYNTRLAAFLDARADALQLAPATLNLSELINVLAPDAVDYGQTPKTPTEHIVEVTKYVAEAVKGAAART